MCCGQKRNALRAAQPLPATALKLHYFGAAPIHIQGSYTGRLYQFSRLHPVQPVDPRDAQPLIETRRFRQAQ